VLAVGFGIVAAAPLWLLMALLSPQMWQAEVSRRDLESYAPVLPLVAGLVALILLVRAGWWSRSWRHAIAATLTAAATLTYGVLLVNEAPRLYGIRDPNNAWTLWEMLTDDVVPVEEVDVGDCMDFRFRTRGAPLSGLVRRVDCTDPSRAEVTRIIEDARASVRARCEDPRGRGLSWFTTGDESAGRPPRVICAVYYGPQLP
jgi:hypothetical protein